MLHSSLIELVPRCSLTPATARIFIALTRPAKISWYFLDMARRLNSTPLRRPSTRAGSCSSRAARPAKWEGFSRKTSAALSRLVSNNWWGIRTNRPRFNNKLSVAANCGR